MSTSPFKEYKAGTPKSLREAIRNGASVAFGPKFDETMKAHIQDFLSQHFSTAFFETENNAELRRLEKLWRRITGDAR